MIVNNSNKVYLFVHVIWSVKDRQALLTKPVRAVLLAHIIKQAAARGVTILAMNGVEDHVHCLLQLLPSQNLSKVIREIKEISSHWLNENKLLQQLFEWEEVYAAYSISPSQVKQVIDFIQKQEEYHKTKSLESELEVFEKVIY